MPGTSYVNGGGARNADDKVLQHNGGGTVAVKNFVVRYPLTRWGPRVNSPCANTRITRIKITRLYHYYAFQ